MASYNIDLYVRIKKVKYIHLLRKIKKLENKVHLLKRENLYYKSLNRPISNSFKNTQEVQNKDNKDKNNNKDNNKVIIEEDYELDDDMPIYMKKIIIKNKENIKKDNNKDIMDEDYELDDEETDDAMPELIEDIAYIENIEFDNNKRNKYKKLDNSKEVIKVINKLKDNLTRLKKNNNLYEKIKTNNRNTLETFANIFYKYTNNEIDDDYITDVSKIYDKNKSRFLKNIEISYKIYSNEKLINSDYIFSLYTFNSLKKTSLNTLIDYINKLL
jgi:hypothetical protein